MADARALLPVSQSPARRRQWEVEFARYFVMPRRSPSAPPPSGLRPLPPGKLRRPGTWLRAAGPAALFISRPHPSAPPILSVSVDSVVFEEHFVSSLNFSWPQVACVTQCPIRGSRVVFMSFCDKSWQIQKFVVRFSQVADAEAFLNCVKEYSREIMDIVPTESDYVCEDSSASENIASNGLHHRFDEASSFQEPNSDYKIKAPALGYDKEPEEHVLEPLLANNIESIFSGFPPSFTDMLTSHSTESEKDKPHGQETYSLTETDHAPQDVCTKNYSCDGYMKGLNIVADGDAGKETGDIMARIKKYMVDDSFHEMLFKLEKVIDELGGDLSL